MPNGKTTIKTAMPIARADLPGAVYDSKIYIFGGYDTSSGDEKGEVRRYDPATDTWDDGDLTSMTYPRWGHAAAVYNATAYIFGGGPAGSGQDEVEAYNIAGDSWSTKATDLPALLQASSGLGAITVGDYIYLFLNVYCYQYDPSDDSYTRMADCPDNPTWATYAYVNVGGEDRIYVIGGYGGGTACNYYYRPDFDDWSAQQAAVPISTYGATRDNPVIDGKIYLAGGYNFYTDIYAFNPTNNTWSDALFPLTYARDGVACGVVNGKLYVMGGRNLTTSPVGLSYNEEFDPSIGTIILGNNTSSTANHAINGYNEASVRTQATENGYLENLYILIGGTVGSNIRVAVYEDDSAYPGALLWESDSIAVPGYQQWVKVPVTGEFSIVSGNYYWFSLQADSNTAIVYVTGPAGSAKYKAQAYGAFTDPFPAGASSTTWLHSIFAELASSAEMSIKKTKHGHFSKKIALGNITTLVIKDATHGNFPKKINYGEAETGGSDLPSMFLVF